MGRTIAALALLTALSATAFAASKVTVHIEGDIAPECAINGAQSAVGFPLDFGDITKPGSKTLAVTVNCNAPFQYGLEAQFGAMTNVSAAEAPNGFVAVVNYDVAIYIPTDGPAISDRCAGENLRAGQVRCRFSNSGDSIALGSQALLTITWNPQRGVPLTGNFVDRLTIMVAASL